MHNKYLALLLVLVLITGTLSMVSAENNNTTPTVNTDMNNTANDIYVNTQGNDKNNGLTIEHPKKTIKGGVEAVKSGGTVHVAPGRYKERIGIGKDVQLIGEGPENTVIDGNRDDSCLSICHNSQVVVKGFTITNGERDYYGAGIYVYDSFLTVQNCIIQNNKAKRDWTAFGARFSGGGIFAYESYLTVENSTIQNNAASEDGGGIYAAYSPTVIRNSVIQNNHADLDGGGIFLYYCSITVENSLIQYNTATKGGGIRTVYGSLKLINTLIQHNIADKRGGGIDSKRTVPEFVDSQVIDNAAPDYPDIF